MKYCSSGIVGMCIIFIIMHSCPQGVLITNAKLFHMSQIEIVDKVYNIENKNLKINIIVPQVKGFNNKNETEVNGEIVNYAESLIKEVEDITKQYFNDKINPSPQYVLMGKYNLTSKNKYLSFYIDYYQYTGGAHGMTTRIAYVLNDKGEKINLSDLFKFGYNYKSVINDEINRQIKMEPDKYFTGKDGFNGINKNQKFYIMDDKLIIYFDLYEIAPYVTGIPEFVIPLENLQDGIK